MNLAEILSKQLISLFVGKKEKSVSKMSLEITTGLKHIGRIYLKGHRS